MNHEFGVLTLLYWVWIILPDHNSSWVQTNTHSVLIQPQGPQDNIIAIEVNDVKMAHLVYALVLKLGLSCGVDL